MPINLAAGLTLKLPPSVVLDDQAVRLPDSKLSAKIGGWVTVAVGVEVGVFVGVRVAVGVFVAVFVGVEVGVRVGVRVAVLVGE